MKPVELVANCSLQGEEMVVLPPLLHPHLRDGGLRGARPPVFSFSNQPADNAPPFQAAQVHLLPRGEFSSVLLLKM